MTKPQSGGAEYEARIRRAERLSAAHPFASEFLNFYKHVASFQKSMRANFAASSALEPARVFAAGNRDALDFTVLLPHYRGFLSVIEQHAPSALQTAARQAALLGSESWIASLNAYWELGGKYDQEVGAFAQFLSRAFLQPHAEHRAAGRAMPPVVSAPRVCPICGARPILGVLRPEGDGGKRRMMCSFCLQEWDFRRIYCPACGEEDEKKLPVYVAEQFPHIRVEACETCKVYVRTIDLTKDGNAVPVVDDLAAIPLSLWAHERGYTRLQPNLLGT